MLPYVHILLSDLKTWFFCQLYMFCGRGGVASGKFLREYWIFYTARRRRKNSEVLGVKMMPHIHILGFFWDQNGAIYTHFFFCGQNAARYTHFRRFLVKMLPYIYTFWVFLGSKCCNIHIFVSFLGGQNDTIHILFCFLSKCCYIYTFCFFLVKMLQHIHICVGFWDQNATIYTHFGGFFGSKCCHIYTFLEFNFFRKNEKKKKQ